MKKTLAITLTVLFTLAFAIAAAADFPAGEWVSGNPNGDAWTLLTIQSDGSGSLASMPEGANRVFKLTGNSEYGDFAVDFEDGGKAYLLWEEYSDSPVALFEVDEETETDVEDSFVDFQTNPYAEGQRVDLPENMLCWIYKDEFTVETGEDGAVLVTFVNTVGDIPAWIRFAGTGSDDLAALLAAEEENAKKIGTDVWVDRGLYSFDEEHSGCVAYDTQVEGTRIYNDILFFGGDEGFLRAEAYVPLPVFPGEEEEGWYEAELNTDSIGMVLYTVAKVGSLPDTTGVWTGDWSEVYEDGEPQG